MAPDHAAKVGPTASDGDSSEAGPEGGAGTRLQVSPSPINDRPSSASSAQGSTAPAVALPPSLGRYRVDHFLARGGMGDVVCVVDCDFDRRLALKVLHADGDGCFRGNCPDRTQLFAEKPRKATLLRRLGRSSILTVVRGGHRNGFDRSLDDNLPFPAEQTL